MNERDSISEAFENYLNSSYFSKQAQAEMAARYGEALAARVLAIYHEAMACQVDWRTATIDTALPVLHDLLDSKYPWLTEKARGNILGAFVLTWK